MINQVSLPASQLNSSFPLDSAYNTKRRLGSQTNKNNSTTTPEDETGTQDYRFVPTGRENDEQLLHGDYTTHLSDDSVEIEDDGERLNFTIVFLSSQMPHHRFRLKVGTVVMLLSNLNTKKGLCNGTKLVISNMRTNVIEAKIQLNIMADGKLGIPLANNGSVSWMFEYLAIGESFRSPSFGFRITHCYISKIVKEVLAAIRDQLLHVLLPSPSENDLKDRASEFWEQWNFPYCIGAIDGKHVRIVCPAKSGSLYFNYKEYCSIVLLAIVDANYKFWQLTSEHMAKKEIEAYFQSR
nr:unnamed protein product [Callosobruchus analis]